MSPYYLVLCHYVAYLKAIPNAKAPRNVLRGIYGILLFKNLLTALLVGKSFEKQADRFAYETMGKGEGIIKFFERLQRKEQKADDAFDITSNHLLNNRSQLPFGKYVGMNMAYYLAKGGHKIGKAFHWLYHNTPLGAHPAHSKRIKAAKEYLEAAEAA